MNIPSLYVCGFTLPLYKFKICLPHRILQARLEFSVFPSVQLKCNTHAVEYCLITVSYNVVILTRDICSAGNI